MHTSEWWTSVMSNPINPNHPANPDATTGYTAADMLPGGCAECDGTGAIWGKRVPRTGGMFRKLMPCLACHGTGDQS